MSSSKTIKYPPADDGTLPEKMEMVLTVQSLDATEEGQAEGNQFDLVPADSWDQYNSYKSPASAMLTVATFAATITFTIILTPRDNDQATPALLLLAYANSLFCGSIVGCILITIAIELCRDSKELEKKRKKLNKAREDVLKVCPKESENILLYWSIKIMFLDIPSWLRVSTPALSVFIIFISGFVGIMLLVAFYLMIYATVLYLKYNGPFILGSAIYLSFGFIALVLWVRNLWNIWLVNMATSGGKRVEDILKAMADQGPPKAGDKGKDVAPKVSHV